MDALEYIKKYGTEKAEEVAIAAGTNLVYFRQIAWRWRKPSPDLAERLVTASGNKLSFERLLRTKTRKFGDPR